VLLLRVGAGSLAELVARSVQPANAPWLDLAAVTAPLDITQLQSTQGGVVFVGELARLSRAQQKNLAFALDRLERYDLRLVVATDRSLEALVGAVTPPSPEEVARQIERGDSELWSLLDAEARTGISLTESCAMWPAASVSGLYLARPEAAYFGLGPIGKDQLADYAARKGWDAATAERWLSSVVG